MQARETAISTIRLAQLRQLDRPLGNFDLDHLREIHRRAFGDVYEWAGKTRREWNTIEGERFLPPRGLSKGETSFADASMIETFLSETFQRLMQDDYLRALPRVRFVEKAGQDWHGMYVATASPGREYAGEVMHRGREASVVQQGERAVVAPTRELGRSAQVGQQVQFTIGRGRGLN